MEIEDNTKMLPAMILIASNYKMVCDIECLSSYAHPALSAISTQFLSVLENCDCLQNSRQLGPKNPEH